MKIVFFGTPDFAVPSLDALIRSRHQVVLVVAQPDRPAGRGMRMRRPPVAQLAIEAGIPLLQPSRIRTEEFLAEVRAARPDLGVVVAYGRILPPPLLEIPAHGFLNVHGSLLPKYRGAAPIQRCIEAGEPVTGVTIMRVDEELDHGPMLGAAEIPIGPLERTPSVAARLAGIGAALLVSVIDAVEDGVAVETPQDHSRATHAAKISREEGRVDWIASPMTLLNRDRAFDPWPGSSIAIGDETVKLHGLEAASGSDAAPGTILRVEADGIVVACGGGAIRVRELQRAGRKPLPASEVARHLGLHEGGSLL
ncbi:MAG TPA: methionyl-tRNA formyltransferase [Thermoanaerobaculia bacterium]|nr:methionyl-tRNA formyltransferase [Thermoanaerobaculia bacterium]